MSESIINVIDTKNKCGKINTILQNKKDKQKHCFIYSMDGCPYCKNLDDELETMKDNIDHKYTKKGEIAKIMSHQLPNVHEVEDSQIDGFPTIIIVSNGKRDETFKGARTSIELINFLLKHGVINSGKEKDTNNIMGRAKRKPKRVKKSLRKGRNSRKSRKSLRNGKKGKK